MRKVVNTVLLSRPFSLVVAFGCCYGAVAAWLAIISGHEAPSQSPLGFFVLLFSTFIAVSIAYRSAFVGDRLVFGMVAIAFGFAIIVRFSLAPPVRIALATGKALLWTAAAIATLVIIVRGLRASGSRPTQQD
jgi:hypothetical protein